MPGVLGRLSGLVVLPILLFGLAALNGIGMAAERTAQSARGAQQGVTCPAVPRRSGVDQEAGTTVEAGGVPATRRAVLGRGVNVTDLFSATGRVDVEGKFRQLRRAGFRHVRVPISPEIFAPRPPVWQVDVLRQLDRDVCAALAADLGIIIDLHPFEPLRPAGGTPEQIGANLEQVWRKLAARYAAVASDRIFFEVLNEPKFTDRARWEAVQQILVHAIREVAPENTIIVTASPWSTAGALAIMVPLPDRNVAYAFHLYTPMIFTHQSAEWSEPSFGSVRGLDFPAQAGNVASVAKQATAALQRDLAAYARKFGDGQLMLEEIDLAAGWARRYGTLVVTTEFGVYGAAPAASRSNWLRDVREALDDRGIGWTVWEYNGGFGIADDLRRGCGDRDSAAKALDVCGR